MSKLHCGAQVVMAGTVFFVFGDSHNLVLLSMDSWILRAVWA